MLTPEAIRREYLDNPEATLESAAKVLGCTKDALWKATRRFNLPAKPAHRPLKAGELGNREWLTEALKSQSPSEIAERLGVSYTAVRAAMRRFNLTTLVRRPMSNRRRAVAAALTDEQIRAAYFDKQDATVRSAAKELGVSYAVMLLALRKRGWAAKEKTRHFNRPSRVDKLGDLDWLREQLVVRGRSFGDVADELGTSKGNVADRAYRHGIVSKATSMSEAAKAAYQKYFPEGRFGEAAPNWRGGGLRFWKRGGGAGSTDRYAVIHSPGHPRADDGGYVPEHILVAEAHLGRFVEPHEEIHHLDGNKLDDRWENLLVTDRAGHVALHYNAVKFLAVAIRALEAEPATPSTLSETLKLLKAGQRGEADPGVSVRPLAPCAHRPEQQTEHKCPLCDDPLALAGAEIATLKARMAELETKPLVRVAVVETDPDSDD